MKVLNIIMILFVFKIENMEVDEKQEVRYKIRLGK